MRLNNAFCALNFNAVQRRGFIFGALGYLKLGALLEGLQRLMSYKLALAYTCSLHQLNKLFHFINILLYSEFP